LILEPPTCYFDWETSGRGWEYVWNVDYIKSYQIVIVAYLVDLLVARFVFGKPVGWEGYPGCGCC